MFCDSCSLLRFCCFTWVGIQFGVTVTLATTTLDVLTLVMIPPTTPRKEEVTWPSCSSLPHAHMIGDATDAQFQ